MSQKEEEENFANYVRELGGDDEDLKMLADADFSGSDWEDTKQSGADTGDLQKDVAEFWSKLSGEKVEPLSKNAANGSKKLETKANDEKLQKKNKKDSDAAKSSAPVKAEKNKAEKSKSEKNKSEKESQLSKPVNDSKPLKREPKTKAPKPVQMSKKEKSSWDQYINSLVHDPRDVLITDQQWSDVANSQASPNASITPEILESVRSYANELLTTENQMYFRSRQTDREFTSSLDFLKSGTFSDQLGTLSILSTESPLHSVRFLENLLSKCEIKNRESACKALEVMKDLLVSHVLPDRRLKWFKDQPIQLGTSQAQLVCWAFEDFLKKLFFQLLQIMERLLADTVENIRTRTLHCVFDFFTSKPEQEANLLRLGLNKLGDPAGKVASRVKKLLMDALQQHPGMKLIVASAMEEALARTDDYRTRYYAIDTLSEFILSNRDPALANKLIFIYLELFERLLNESKTTKDDGRAEPSIGKPVKTGKRFRPKRGKKGGIQQQQADATETENQQHARLVAKLFTGLNRAFPFCDLDPSMFSKYTDTMYQMSHSPNVGTFIEALSFIFQLSKTVSSSSAVAGKDSGSSMDRYYRALYDSLLDGRLPHSSKLGKYIHLLLKSMAELKSEVEVPRSTAFVKRMLQIACNLSEVGVSASLIHVATLTPNRQLITGKFTKDSGSADGDASDSYDPKQRDPRFANAEKSQAWETLLLQHHYHPTVALYANNILAEPKDKKSLEMPDIDQYSVNQFLNKWSYQKPKAKESTRGGSIFQPLAGFTDLNLGVRFNKRDVDAVPASMQDWKSKNVGEIAPEDLFMYDYFVQRPDRKPKKKPEDKSATENGAQNDNSDDSDDLAEDEINEAMSRSGPGDSGNVNFDLEGMSDEDDKEDGDLDAELAAAFNSDDSDSDGMAEAGEEGDDDDDDDDLIDEADFDEGQFAAAGNEDDLDVVGDDDDFTQFDKENSTKDNAEDKKTRKRAWTQLPTFLDADAFDEMEFEQKSNKRRN